MPLHGYGLALFLSGALGCGTAWASEVAGEAPKCPAGGAAGCRPDEPHRTPQTEEQEGVSQLQTAAAGWLAPGCKSCEKLATEVTKTCQASKIWECIGMLDDEGSVETKLPHSCAKDVAPWGPGVHVYKVYNDYSIKHSFKGEDFCLGPPAVDFDYAMSCFGDKHGKCQEQGCIQCDGGEVSPPGETCDFAPGETKYMTVWFKRKPCCSKLAPEVTKECQISDLMNCIGMIDNENPVETELDDKCAIKAGIPNPGAKVYKVHNDQLTPQSLKGEDFCFGPPHVDFKYAMSCFGNDGKGSCENQGCISCVEGEVSPPGETCDFKPGETKYMTVWFEK